MAIHDLEVVVEVDITSALQSLQRLEEELEQVADEIRRVDRIGTEGIDVNTYVDDISNELSALTAEIEAWERTNRINVATDVDSLGLDGGGDMSDALRNSMRAGFIDALQSEDVSILGGGDGGGSVSRVDVDPNAITRSNRLRGLMGRDVVGRRPQFGRADRNMSLMRRLRRTMRGAAEKISEFSDNSAIANLNMSDLHNMMARLIPLLLVLIGTLPALITAFVTLATAAFAAAASLMALTAFGAMGLALEDGQFDMQNLTNVWEDIRQNLIEAFAPLAERLQPLFEDGVEGLERFFQLVANEGDALVALSDEARAFGGFVMDFVPSALRSLAALVEAFAPTFGRIGQWLQRNFNDVVRGAVELTAEAIPAITVFVGSLMRMVPALVRVSIGFTRVATGVFAFINAIGRILSILPITTEQFGFLVGVLLVSITAVALLNSAIVSLAFNAMVALGKSVLAAIGTLTGYDVAAFIATLSTYSLAQAVLFLIGIVTLGLGAVAALGAAAATMGDHFKSAAGNIRGAASALDDYDSVASGTRGSGFNPYGQGGEDGASGGSGTSIEYNSYGGDPRDDRENTRYLKWREGRTSGTRG